ncbi:MAG: hypothetical protein ACM3JG_01405 [Thiohalocapsa sp.]
MATEELVEMANLTAAQTGVPGTIFISTVMGGHGPRVKYFVQPGRNQPSFSVLIADPPRVVANSLPDRVLRQRSSAVVRWVTLNRDALLDFWNNGDSWTDPQVTSFKQALKRI